MKAKPTIGITTILIVLFLFGVIYLISKNSGTQPGMHMMNGQMMNNDEMQNTNYPVQSHRSYLMKISSDTSNYRTNVPTIVIFKIVDERNNVLKDFVVNHTKLMHFIVVRNDLQDFQHLHPDFNAVTGEFTIPVVFTDNGKYRLFADFTPTGGQKDTEGNYLGVTSFQDVTVGDLTKYVPKDIVPDTQTVKSQGDYQISYSFPQPVQSGTPLAIRLTVLKNYQPVTDMEEYLGAQAHGILLQKDTLDFAHLHAMGEAMTHMMNGQMMTMQSSMSTGPEIKFDYTFPSKGIYKLFTQFQEQGKVNTADYVIDVK